MAIFSSFFKLISGSKVDRGNKVCNFEGNFINFKQVKKNFNISFIVFELLEFK